MVSLSTLASIEQLIVKYEVEGERLTKERKSIRPSDDSEHVGMLWAAQTYDEVIADLKTLLESDPSAK